MTYHSKYIALCDIEASGLDPVTNDLLELAMIICDRDLNILKRIHLYSRPTRIGEPVWTKEAERVHKITPERAMDFPSKDQFCEELLSSLVPYMEDGPGTIEFVCHAQAQSYFDKQNNRFSWGMIDYCYLEWQFRKIEKQYEFWKFFSRENCTSTVKMSIEAGYGKAPLLTKDGREQRTLAGNVKKEGNGLKIWSKRLGKKNFNHHSAVDDTDMLFEIYKHLCSINSGNTKTKGSLI